MMQFDYKYQNPSGFACLMPIRASVIFTPLRIQNLDKIRKKTWIVVIVVKWWHCESCLVWISLSSPIATLSLKASLWLCDLFSFPRMVQYKTKPTNTPDQNLRRRRMLEEQKKYVLFSNNYLPFNISGQKVK